MFTDILEGEFQLIKLLFCLKPRWLAVSNIQEDHNRRATPRVGYHSDNTENTFY